MTGKYRKSLFNFCKRFAHPLNCYDISIMYAITYVREFLLHTVRLVMRNGHERFITDFKKLIHTRNESADSQIRSYFSRFLRDRTLMEFTSPGAGSRRNKTLTISEYARRTAVSPAKGNLLYQIAAFYQPELIIELGTSLGLSTMYMAKGSPRSRVITVEGNPQIADIAATSFRTYQLDQVSVIKELFDDALPKLIRNMNANTMVFIDGNHTYEATIKYVNAFSKAKLIVLDDIRWSAGMLEAWREIVANRGDATVIDLFTMGILIRDENLTALSFAIII